LFSYLFLVALRTMSWEYATKARFVVGCFHLRGLEAFPISYHHCQDVHERPTPPTLSDARKDWAVFSVHEWALCLLIQSSFPPPVVVAAVAGDVDGDDDVVVAAENCWKYAMLNELLVHNDIPADNCCASIDFYHCSDLDRIDEVDNGDPCILLGEEVGVEEDGAVDGGDDDGS